jgi:hypothetical protein
MTTYSRDEMIAHINSASQPYEFSTIASLLKDEEMYYPPVVHDELRSLLQLQLANIAESHLALWQMLISDIASICND